MQSKKILFTGGGTLGSVTPLLAVVEQLKDHKFIWVGTRKGPEKKLIKQAGIKFKWILAPKLRRYFDLRNFFAPILFGISVIWSFLFLLVIKPDIIVTAGGFVGVPFVWTGHILGIPSLLHNQDVKWSLSNKLVARYVKLITYSLPNTLPKKYDGKAVWTGNPIREAILNGNKSRGMDICGFDDKKPVVMVVGGGTGAQSLNDMVYSLLPELLRNYQIIHLTGKGKGLDKALKGYYEIEFASKEMGDLYAVSDVVVTRAGMGALTELTTLGKNIIAVPIPDTHQEKNAEYFEKAGVIKQKKIISNNFVEIIENTLNQPADVKDKKEKASEIIRKDAGERVGKEILKLA